MLPKEITEPHAIAARRPLPVGRSYALRVLFGVEGQLPMPGVSVKLVRRHCHAALVQTSVRDAAAIAAAVTAVTISPMSTLVALALIAAFLILIRRTRLRSPVALGMATGVALALIWGWRSAQESYSAPAISAGICFLIYLVDIVWSLRQVRRLSRPPTQPQIQESDSIGITITPSDIFVVNEEHWAEFTAIGQDKAKRAPSANKVFYDNDGIIGAGAPSSPFPLTIPLDERLHEDQEMTEFTAPELLAHIEKRIASQGIGDGKLHGHAFGPGSANVQGNSQASHFTYGLPDLKVDIVNAAPFPGLKKEYPILHVGVVHLDTSTTAVEDRSPSAHPERYYVRATTVSWDGQLVVSLYVNAALQGHYLRMMIRPYVIAPIVSELKSADKLVKRHPLMRAYATVQLTAREFTFAAKTIRTLTENPRKREKAKDSRPTGRSTRERYAQLYLDNMHQEEDAQRIIRIVEQKVVFATVDYLRECNISTGEYETQIINKIENTIIGGGVIYSGNVTDSQISTATGQGATATSQGNPASAKNSPPK